MALRRQLLSVLFLSILMSMSVITLAHGQTSTPDVEDPKGEKVLISIRPKEGVDGDRFTSEVEPGSQVQLTAVLQNFGDEPIELRTYTSDVVPMANGGIAIAELDSEQHAPTTWMSYPTETFTLDSMQMIEKSLNISVPEGTAPGQYVNAVALETVNPIKQANPDSPFRQYFRKVVSVYIIVPGPLEADFAFGEPSVQHLGPVGTIEVPLNNMGNVRLDLTGSVTLQNESGDIFLEGPIPLGPIYNGQKTVMQIFVPALPPAGTYYLSGSFSDNESGVSRALSDVPIEFPEVESAAVGVVFENALVEPIGDPIQLAVVSVDITLPRDSYRSTRLTLSVFHEGEMVDEFVLADNLSLSQGTTSVQQRYLPLTGWNSGTYTFSFTLEDTSSGGSTKLYSEDDVATIEVP